MTEKEFNKAKFEREMKNEYSNRDIMVRGKKVDFKTQIKNRTLSELMYGDKTPQNRYAEVWDNFKRYN